MSTLRVSVFAVMANKVSKRMLITSLLGERGVLSGLALIHFDKSRHRAQI